MTTTSQRRTTQFLMPLKREAHSMDVYDIYPAHEVESGAMAAGFEALACQLARHNRVAIDGFVGIDWEDFRKPLDAALKALGVQAEWRSATGAMWPADVINKMVEPFLGGDDPIFGTRFTGAFTDFFDGERLVALRSASAASHTIIYGCGAALVDEDAFLVYVDLPKNELQFRSRAGVVKNLGADKPDDAKRQYKRFYFVDWPALNQHRITIVQRIAVIVDGQHPEGPSFMDGGAWRKALDQLAHGSFRARPWFEPGPWGGHWISEKIPGLASDVPNYAWSFELISPENGLVFTNGGLLLECSFDWLMAARREEVIGERGRRFGREFPIRFDYLDTMRGGNLSLQCHPRPEYIRRNFGETFTQDETYYIMDCEPGALVYLGFNEGVDPAEFHAALRESYDKAVPFDAEKYAKTLVAEKHGLYLIPNGTIHCSGTGNMVLEISATPYIFTFKMYDWMRLDLDGKPRPLNIDRAMENLYFERQGSRVEEELVSRPRVLREEAGGRLVHLPTHPEHFYDIHRFELSSAMEEQTDGSVHVMCLVEGERVLLHTPDGRTRRFHYAETFCVSAAAGSYLLETENGEAVKVVKAFLKPTA